MIDPIPICARMFINDSCYIWCTTDKSPIGNVHVTIFVRSIWFPEQMGMPSNGAMAFRCNQTGSRKISSKLRYGWNLSRYACLSADVAKSRRSRELDCCIWCAYDHIRIYRVHAVVHFAELLLLHRLKMANTNEIELCCRIVGIQHDSAGFFFAWCGSLFGY